MDWGWVILALIVAVFGILLPYFKAKRMNRTWGECAHLLGMQFRTANLFRWHRIYGSIEGMAVDVDIYREGTGKNKTSYTRFIIAFPAPLGLGLVLKGEGLFSKVTKFFGAQDIQTGDDVFDKSVMIKGWDLNRIAEFLTPARRTQIHRCLTSYGGVEIDDRGIYWGKREIIVETHRLLSIIRGLVNVAWHLTDDRSEDESIERAMRAQYGGSVEEALSILGHGDGNEHEAEDWGGHGDRNRTDTSGYGHEDRSREDTTGHGYGDGSREVAVGLPPAPAETAGEAADYRPVAVAEQESVEKKVLQGDLLYLSGRPKQAKKAFEQALEQAPEDPEIRGWVDHLAGQEPATPPAESTTGSEPLEALDVKSVCQTLFNARVSSFEAANIFEKEYEGKEVSWSGNIRSVAPYSYDLVFRDRAGIKATLELYETQSNVYSENKILAIVQFPEDLEEHLKAEIGKPLPFRGVLKKVDALMKNIYVAHGALD